MKVPETHKNSSAAIFPMSFSPEPECLTRMPSTQFWVIYTHFTGPMSHASCSFPSLSSDFVTGSFKTSSRFLDHVLDWPWGKSMYVFEHTNEVILGWRPVSKQEMYSGYMYIVCIAWGWLYTMFKIILHMEFYFMLWNFALAMSCFHSKLQSSKDFRSRFGD